MEIQININAPEGYVIDTEKSTATEVFFKPIEREKKFPMSWESLGEVMGYRVDSFARIIAGGGFASKENRNFFPTEAEAEASVALAQLLQLRNAWGGYHTKDEKDLSYGLPLGNDCYPSNVFRFKDEATRDLFQETFKDLITKASPLL